MVVLEKSSFIKASKTELKKITIPILKEKKKMMQRGDTIPENKKRKNY